MLSVLIAFLLSLFGITTSVTPTPPDPPEPQDFEVVVRVGETERVLIGTTNQSARRTPVIVTEPEPGVATLKVTREDPPADCNPGGCEEPTYANITGAAPGKASFEVQECFVPNKDECEPMGPVQQYVVVVEG